MTNWAASLVSLQVLPKRCTPGPTAQVWRLCDGFLQKQACFLAFPISFAKNQLGFKKMKSAFRKIKLDFGKKRLFFAKTSLFFSISD
jgi:hypothetical protein